MKLVNERQQIAEMIERFSKLARRHRLTKQLKALNILTATAEDVEKIVGNACRECWVHPMECNECKKRTYELVEMGEEPNEDKYIHHWSAALCRECLLNALRLMDEAKGSLA